MVDADLNQPAIVPPDLLVEAECLDERLRAFVLAAGWTSAVTAAELLNVTEATLLEMVTGGEIAAAVVDSAAWVNPATLQLRVLERGLLGEAVTRESRTLARAGLRRFLAARPVTGDWDVAREQGRPLVCRRRGRGWVSHGIEHHSVVLNARWLASWVVGEARRAPELAGMPVGPRLTALLADLPGVEPVTSATPLCGERPRARNVSGWVRVDPASWPVLVPDDVAVAVGPPVGADR